MRCLKHGRPGFNPWVGKIPWRREWQPTPAFLPGKRHGRRNLEGYSPGGRKESDMTSLLYFFMRCCLSQRENLLAGSGEQGFPVSLRRKRHTLGPSPESPR